MVEGWLTNQMAGPVGARHLFDFQTDVICELGHPWPPPPTPPPRETQLQKSFYGPFLLFPDRENKDRKALRKDPKYASGGILI